MIFKNLKSWLQRPVLYWLTMHTLPYLLKYVTMSWGFIFLTRKNSSDRHKPLHSIQSSICKAFLKSETMNYCPAIKLLIWSDVCLGWFYCSRQHIFFPPKTSGSSRQQALPKDIMRSLKRSSEGSFPTKETRTFVAWKRKQDSHNQLPFMTVRQKRRFCETATV